jgi:hypothetical protein
MSAEAAINALNVIAATLPGIKRVYADPPESISEFPCAMTYIESGFYDTAAGWRGTHTLILDIYESRTVIQQAIDAAKSWPDKVRVALKAKHDGDNTWGGAISHVGDGQMFFRYRAGPMLYNDIQHYGVRFWVIVKENYG